MFTPDSRYTPLPELEHELPDGRVVVYKARRFLPKPEAFQALGQERVVVGDRPDLLAARTLGDPGAWVHLADANGALHPMDLVRQPGRPLTLPMPTGGE
ncbi:MAG: LysM domain-containing protein [Alphaproteobacteria bacterium]|nr:LysM domain-containing protein [Alphaproteobacteria bacterium]